LTASHRIEEPMVRFMYDHTTGRVCQSSMQLLYFKWWKPFPR